MGLRLQVAPLARRPYHPGVYAPIYHNLEAGLRKKIDGAVDDIFVKKTGVQRKLNEHSLSDRPLVRQWLLTRDAVIAWYIYNKLLVEEHARGVRARVEARLQAESIRNSLPQALADGAPKTSEQEEALEKVKVPLRVLHFPIEAAHIAEMLEVAEWAEASPAAYGVEGLLGAFGSIPAVALALPITLAAGLHEIAESHAAGDTEARRTAYCHGFASQLVYGQIMGALPANSDLGSQQIRGQKAANRMLDSMTPNVRTMFIRVYRAKEKRINENMEKALHDLGAH